jgi:hypothetical protein
VADAGSSVREGADLMSKPGKALLDDQGGAAVASPVRRINVAVTEPMLAAIDRVVDLEHVTLTEAVRRLIAYGDFVYEVAKERNATLVVRDARGEEREVVVL